MQTSVATWYYEQGTNEGGVYAQVPLHSASERFRDVYRRSLAVQFASARVANPDASLLLYVNRPWRKVTAVGLSTERILADIGVSMIEIDYASAPPVQWPMQWRNQFFVLDVLRSISRSASAGDCVVLLDSDVLWTGHSSTRDLWDAIATKGCLTYEVGFASDHPENGLTGFDVATIYNRMMASDLHYLPYVGGEIQAVRGDYLARLTACADEMWAILRADYVEGKPCVTEEAHLLNLAYTHLDVPIGSANGFIRRCWTQQFNNLDGHEMDLALWHLPAEKRFGLRRIFEDIETKGFSAWEATYSRHGAKSVGAWVGIPRAGISKRLYDTKRRLSEAHETFLGRA